MRQKPPEWVEIINFGTMSSGYQDLLELHIVEENSNTFRRDAIFLVVDASQWLRTHKGCRYWVASCGSSVLNWKYHQSIMNPVIELIHRLTITHHCWSIDYNVNHEFIHSQIGRRHFMNTWFYVRIGFVFNKIWITWPSVGLSNLDY